MLLSLLFLISGAWAQSFDSSFYHQRYGLTDIYVKRVDNRGNGYENLYGVRNFREVLSGVLYRGGANNMFHRDRPRANSNPLPDDGLLNLCEEGFRTAVYLYSTNYSTAPARVRCSSIRGVNDLAYEQISPNSRNHEILRIVREAILDPRSGPVYVHCWNGWHASGLISALALRQFCDWPAADALQYWETNVDGVNGPEYDPVRRRIRDFTAYADLRISPADRARVCP